MSSFLGFSIRRVFPNVHSRVHHPLHFPQEVKYPTCDRHVPLAPFTPSHIHALSALLRLENKFKKYP